MKSLGALAHDCRLARASIPRDVMQNEMPLKNGLEGGFQASFGRAAELRASAEQQSPAPTPCLRAMIETAAPQLLFRAFRRSSCQNSY